jgi:HEAT repeat protein
MRLGGRVVPALALLALAVASAGAQNIPQDDRDHQALRNRYEKPRQDQKLDEAVRNFASDDAQTRLDAVEALGQNADQAKARETLMQGANDPDLAVRIKSIDVIGDAKVKDATPLLVQQLFMRDTTLATKQRILAALGKIGDPRATRPILDFMARDVDANVRGNAIFALGDIGDKQALASLQKISDGTDPNLRALAQAAIRKIQQKPAPAVVPPALAADKRPGPQGDNATP